MTRVTTLDNALKNEPVTFIKADIEGFEMDMLYGARETICQNKPRLAICLYHKNADLFEIPLLIHDLEPRYTFAIRHHSHTMGETVLYAW